MILEEVFPNTFCLQIPLELDVDSINVFLFAGKVPALLDTGTRTPEVLAAIRQGMQETGIKRFDRILTTHWHVDHAGAAVDLADEQTEILISARDYVEWQEFMEKAGSSSLENVIFKAWGVPESDVQSMIKMAKWLRKLAKLPEKAGFINDGDILEVGDYCLEVIDTPGHSPGHVSYFLRNESLLLSGDLLLPDMIPYPGAWTEGEGVISGMPLYVDSVKRIEKLNADRYYPAHGAPHNYPSDRCRQILEQLQHQVRKYQPGESVYATVMNMNHGKAAGNLFYLLHHVYGWEELQKRGVY